MDDYCCGRWHAGELVPGVNVTDKDMESDEATWALYEQWCKAFNKVRDRSEMARRFHMFKRTAGFEFFGKIRKIFLL
jgi:hypothetical protein